jgi:hypothetical protein
MQQSLTPMRVSRFGPTVSMGWQMARALPAPSTWTNASFGLQSAPAAEGTYTNIGGATSPYTNVFSDTQRYFRLKLN